MDRSAALELIRTARVARLATVSEGGDPHLVPIVFAVDDDAIVSAVDHKPKRSRRLRRLENIRRNSAVSVLVDHYEEDWDRLWWVRIDGHAEVLIDGRAFDSALVALTAKYSHYESTPPAGPVIRVGCESVSGWAADGR